LPLSVDTSLADLANHWGGQIGPESAGWPLLRIKLSQTAPILPYLLLVLILIFRPKGLLGTRDE
jgi:branched-chain amino acid transport system permease protein